MSSTSWNDAENDALDGLSADAQLMYLRGIRRHMNYKTGVSRFMSMSHLKRALEFRPVRGSRLPERKATDIKNHYVRARIIELERNGLVRKVEAEGKNKFDAMSFVCCLADCVLVRPNEEPQGNRKETCDKGAASELIPSTASVEVDDYNSETATYDDKGMACAASDDGAGGDVCTVSKGFGGTATLRDSGKNINSTHAGAHTRQSDFKSPIDDSFKIPDGLDIFVRVNLSPDPPDLILCRLDFIEHYSDLVDPETEKDFVTTEKMKGKLFRKWLLRAKRFQIENAKKNERIGHGKSSQGWGLSAFDDIIKNNPGACEPAGRVYDGECDGLLD